MFEKQYWCNNGSVCDVFVEWINFLKVVTSSRCDLSCKSYLWMLRYAGNARLTFHNQTSRFDWCVVRWRFKNKHHKNTCFKGDWTTFSTFINYSTLTIEHNWEDLYIQPRNRQTCTFGNTNWIKGGLIFIPVFGWCFIVHLLMPTQISSCRPKR